MYRTAIVEDTSEEVDLLRSYLIRYGSERSIVFAVSTFSNGRFWRETVPANFIYLVRNMS